MKREAKGAADINDVRNRINEDRHKVLENKLHEVHDVLEVLHVVLMLLEHVNHECAHCARHVLRACEVDLEVVHRAVNANTVKMPKKYLKLSSLGAGVCRIQVALDFLKFDNIALEQILKVQEAKLDVSGPP